MKLLLDSQIFIWSVQDRARIPSRIAAALARADGGVWLSVATLWEIRLKQDKGKLSLADDLPVLVDDFISASGTMLPVSPRHALHVLPDPPFTLDPFDRMLLAQCDVEAMRLMTADAALTDHRLAWRE